MNSWNQHGVEQKRKKYSEELVALSILGHFDAKSNLRELEGHGGDTEAAHQALTNRLQRASGPNISGPPVPRPQSTGQGQANGDVLQEHAWPFRGDSGGGMLNPMQTEDMPAEPPSWAFDGLELVQAKKGVNHLRISGPTIDVPNLPTSPTQGPTTSPQQTAGSSDDQMSDFAPGQGQMLPNNYGDAKSRKNNKRSNAPDPEEILNQALSWSDPHTGTGVNSHVFTRVAPDTRFGIPSVGLTARPAKKRQKLDMTPPSQGRGRKLHNRNGDAGPVSRELELESFRKGTIDRQPEPGQNPFAPPGAPVFGPPPRSGSSASCNNCHIDGIGNLTPVLGSGVKGLNSLRSPLQYDDSNSPSDVGSFRPMNDMRSSIPMEDARQRKIAAQRRYREKKKNELERLKNQEKELVKLQRRLEALRPFEVIAKVERARIDTGKRPRQWCYVETWPECKIISETLCHEALGYTLLGRHCWDYKRFPGLKRENTETLKRHWNATVTKGGYPLYDFLDNQFFERLTYRDNQPSWRWCQVLAYRLNDPSQHPTLLQCLETDCHEAVMFGRRHGLTEYLKNVGPNHAFHYLLKSNGAYTYQCYVSAAQTQQAASEDHAKLQPKVEGNEGSKSHNNATVVSRSSPRCREVLGWEMAGMSADDKDEGHGVPLLHGKNNKLREIITKGRTSEPMYYKRRVQKTNNVKAEDNAPDMEDAAMAQEMMVVEAWGHLVRPAGDGGVFIDILERNAVPDQLKEVLGLT